MARNANVFDVQVTADSLNDRIIREDRAVEIDGGKPRRTRHARPAQVALKTTEATKAQLLRLAELTRRSQIEVFELALDALEREVQAELKATKGKRK